MNPKISIITVVFNAKNHIKDCVESVLAQDYPNYEYLLIDGASTDGTLAIVDSYRDKLDYFVSEPDKGMYDALNKGIAAAKGDVIGILNADDILASPDVLSNVARQFEDELVDALYGDLNYVSENNTQKIVRKWRDKSPNGKAMAWGWMPAHPTFYARSKFFDQYGNYRTDFGSAADYELMLRFLYTYRLNAVYLPLLMVNMRVGGMSNATWRHRVIALLNDYKAMTLHKIPFPVLTIVLKKMRKLKQFV